MNASQIEYSRNFARQFRALPSVIQQQAIKKESLFKENPLHPSLRLHQLKGKLTGLWSISITLDYRIMFAREESGVIIFVSIGRHAIYNQ